jgi:hypothetical protein
MIAENKKIIYFGLDALICCLHLSYSKPTADELLALRDSGTCLMVVGGYPSTKRISSDRTSKMLANDYGV